MGMDKHDDCAQQDIIDLRDALSPQQVANAFRQSIEVVMPLVRHGDIWSVRKGRDVLIPRSELCAFPCRMRARENERRARWSADRRIPQARQRYADAYRFHTEGRSWVDIGHHFGVSASRARRMAFDGAAAVRLDPQWVLDHLPTLPDADVRFIYGVKREGDVEETRRECLAWAQRRLDHPQDTRDEWEGSWMHNPPTGDPNRPYVPPPPDEDDGDYTD